MKKNKQKGSIIKWILILIALIALASFFFDFSVQDVVEDEQTQQNFGYIWTNISYLYETYLSNTVNYLWNDIFIDLIWNNFIHDLSSIRAGEPTMFEKLAPSIEVSR